MGHTHTDCNKKSWWGHFTFCRSWNWAQAHAFGHHLSYAVGTPVPNQYLDPSHWLILRHQPQTVLVFVDLPYAVDVPSYWNLGFLPCSPWTVGLSFLATAWPCVPSTPLGSELSCCGVGTLPPAPWHQWQKINLGTRISASSFSQKAIICFVTKKEPISFLNKFSKMCPIREN